MSVAVVTDTTSYVPGEQLAALDVSQVSLYVGWEGDLRPEHEYVDLDAFYARLRASETLPQTSQPSVGDFLAVYEPLVAAGRDVVSIHIAEGLSGTCQSAREAAKALQASGHAGRVEVLDAQTGAGGLGLMVLAAAEAAGGGADAGATLAAARDARERLEMWFCLDTLEFLRKGGRIGAARALLGSALQIKPILTFGTEIAPVGRVRTRRRAFERMIDYLGELRERGATEWIVQHAQSAQEAQRLVDAGTEILSAPPRFCTQVGPVLGAHLGSGLLVGGLTSR
ncbi:MAG: DegV family protein [Solirubrobacteraceae bacterium]